ncbi:MAG: PadR family transcriptional regulator [Bryobacteraceae bacterium]|nr:PadR family transcriptional regulator [Bryobacteraceae bacterium]
MGKSTTEVLQGTLDLMILKALSLQPMHGWAIAQRIEQVSAEHFSVNQGSLYPALHRLERKGWIDSEPGVAENNRTVKVYRLTRLGRNMLAEEQDSWRRNVAAVARVLEAE